MNEQIKNNARAALTAQLAEFETEKTKVENRIRELSGRVGMINAGNILDNETELHLRSKLRFLNGQIEVKKTELENLEKL